MSLAVVGHGAVGKCLARMALTQGIKVVGVSDLAASALAPSGLTAADLDKAGDALAVEGGAALSAGVDTFSTSEFESKLLAYQSSTNERVVVADCTAAEATLAALLSFQRAGLGVALANKKPVSSSLKHFKELTSQPKNFRFECTVGAGLPTIVAMQRLVSSGENVRRIKGAFSGTLGYICTGLQEGKRFSDVVSTAKSLGFTEPDPRDDLSGTDVARKALILARIAGLEVEMSDVEVEPLYPKAFAELSVEEFMKRLPELDDEMEEKVKRAALDDARLRYAASVDVDAKTLKVGLVHAKIGSDALANLSGTGNLMVVETDYYLPENPLAVSGPGAGVEVTAGGVLADVVELLRH